MSCLILISKFQSVPRKFQSVSRKLNQYISRAEHSSINVIFEGVQTQLQNEKDWLCAINTSETAREIDTSHLMKTTYS